VTVASGFDVSLLEAARLGDELVAVAVERALRGRSGVYDVTVTRASDQAESADQLRRDVRAQRALVDGRLHQARQLVVDDPPALEGDELDRAVPPDTQEQRHGGQMGGQDLDGLANCAAQPLVGSGPRICVRRPVDRGRETVERLVEGRCEQGLLARHVVVDR
jgi:hypothetical protein